MGKKLFTLYCVQCHGENGHGGGPASNLSNLTGGYITPVPANLTKTGENFEHYGQYVWKVKNDVETTNMPPWNYSLTDEEIYQIIFYDQNFSTTEGYNSKWAPLYTDQYARNLRKG